uniref:Uncharacterized protein n=1 Tax=Rangifer tarandus platyrhynchus TaxID=3082113 RepID=A0ACB0FNC7_RANTA|nr:unnamed protein product [Rangifer tarandus platyrhynchus]
MGTVTLSRFLASTADGVCRGFRSWWGPRKHSVSTLGSRPASRGGLHGGAHTLSRRPGCRHLGSAEGGLQTHRLEGPPRWLWSRAQAPRLWGPLLSTGTPMTAGHSRWHTREQGQGAANSRIDGLAAGEPDSACQCRGRRLVLGPQAVCGKGVAAVGYSTVIAGSHHRYTQGTVACDGAQASGVQVRSGRCGPTVCTPRWGPLQRSRVCLAPRAAADVRVDCQSGSCAPGGSLRAGRGEEGDIQAAGVCEDETYRKESSVVKSAGGGRGGWWLCQPLVS